jgi:hypothetical protein
MRQGAAKKAGRYPLARQVLLYLCAADACLRHWSDQVEGKRPNALALATACVRLWMPSLP